MGYKNIYSTIFFILLALLSSNIVVFRVIVPRIFSQNVPNFLVILGASTFIIGIVALFVIIILYAREEERITRTTYVNFARELGCDEVILNKFKEPQYGSRRTPGVWAQIKIKYKNHDFVFSGENVLGSNRFGCFRYFLISLKKDDMFLCAHKDLFVQLNPEERGLFEEMQKRLGRGWLYKEHRLQLFCQERSIFCRIPLSSKVALHDLQKAMDILLSIK